MFDMQHVSKTISRLRKENNLTQMELADQLNISFQAVSNWERGQTMPDISKLGELAGIFGVSIDELLGNSKSTEVVESLVHDEEPDDLSTEDFLDVAPLVKPAQAEKLWETVRGDISMKDLVRTAPFISEQTLDALAVEAAQREKSFEHFTGLLPFLSKDAINQCLDFVLEDGVDGKRLLTAAPFLGKENLSRLADRITEIGSVEDLVPLAPFIKKKKLTEAAAHFIDQKGFSAILPLLPFLDKDHLDKLIRRKRETE